MNLKLLSNRNFLLLMQGKFVSQLGTTMQTFALSLYVLNTYDSATLFASILMIAFIPRIILSPIAGVFVDWFDRKVIIVALDILSGLVVLSLTLMYFALGTLPLWSIYGITIVLSLINVLFGPAVSTVIPVLMKDEDLFHANTWDQMVLTMANILGPIIAGILMGFTGIGFVLLINGGSFLLSALSEMFIKLPKHNLAHEELSFKVFRRDFTEGLRYMRINPILVKILVISFILNFALSPVFSVAMPFVLKKVMMISDVHFGMYESIVVAASIIGMLAAGAVANKFSVVKILIIDVFTQPVIMAVIAFISSGLFLSMFSGYGIPLASMILVTCMVIIVITIGNITFSTLLQKAIPKTLLGRVQTLTGTISMAAIPLGQGLMGIALDYWPPSLPIGIATVILVFMAFYTKANFAEGSIDLAAESA